MRKTFALFLLVSGLAAVYAGSQALATEEPIEGAGALVEAGSRGVSDAPKAPKIERKNKPAAKKEAPAHYMVASYYGYALAGLPTASGEPFNPKGLTAAHKSLPLGTRLLVKRNGASVEVTVNDRGPYIAGRDLDLSVGAARAIGLTGPGEDAVQVVLL